MLAREKELNDFDDRRRINGLAGMPGRIRGHRDKAK
jgi:hypothetical protein